MKQLPLLRTQGCKEWGVSSVASWSEILPLYLLFSAIVAVGLGLVLVTLGHSRTFSLTSSIVSLVSPSLLLSLLSYMTLILLKWNSEFGDGFNSVINQTCSDRSVRRNKFHTRNYSQIYSTSTASPTVLPNRISFNYYATWSRQRHQRSI